MNAIETHRNQLESTSSSDGLLDSLPYAETVHEDYEEYALALIEEEMKAIAPRSMNKIAPINFRTQTMQTEYETLVVQRNADDSDTPESFVRSRPKEQLNFFQHKKISKPKTIEEWKDKSKNGSNALSEIKSRYEAERIRGLVLEAEREEGVAIWKDYNKSLDESAAFWTKSLKCEVDKVEEINFRRQQAQTQQVGPEIDRLNQQYEQALYRRNELTHAIEGLRRKNENNKGDDEARKRKAATIA
mmetsp:Transcript_4026/g.9136  ORF Transcript_4026/g.9136 Transcript_4026/m.9136 type:complete len:245 (-) Transcript_4026:51-785(-)